MKLYSKEISVGKNAIKCEFTTEMISDIKNMKPISLDLYISNTQHIRNVEKIIKKCGDKG